MTTFASRIRQAYSLFVHSATSAQSAFLLFVRLYWGWQFAVDGGGKLHNLPKVTEYFGSLGLPAPGPTAFFVSILELVGGVLLALGLGSRLTALLLTANLTVAYITGDREALLSILSNPDKFSAAAPFTYLMGIADRANFQSGTVFAGLAYRAFVASRFAGPSAIGSKWLLEGARRLGGASVKLRFPLMLVSVGCGSLCNLLNWIRRSATAVCAYYGKHPVSHVTLDVHG